MSAFLKSWCSHVPQRFVVCALSTGALLVCLMDRQLFYTVMHNLVDHSELNEDLNSLSSCPKMINSDEGRHDSVEFYWEAEVIRAIAQSFYIGFLITLIPAGMMADYFGAQMLLIIGLLITSVMALCSPCLAGKGPWYLGGARFFQGVAQAMVFPSASVMVVQWAPITERVTFCAILTSGEFMGWGLGYMLQSTIKFVSDRWKIQFYVAGVLGVLWAILVYGFTTSRPGDSHHITDAELTMIFQQSEGIDRQSQSVRPYVPWRALVRSVPLWSLLLINWSSCWVHYTLLMNITSYFHNVVRITNNLSEDVAAFAEFVIAPSTIFWGVVSDWLVNHQYLDRYTCKKAFMVTGNLVLAPLLLVVPLVGCDGPLTVALYLVICYWRGIYCSMYRAAILDLGPQHGGVLTSLLKCSDAIAALFSYQLLISIRNKPSDVIYWWKVFGVLAAMLVVFSLSFLWFGSTRLQRWNSYRGRSRVVFSSRIGSIHSRNLQEMTASASSMSAHK